MKHLSVQCIWKEWYLLLNYCLDMVCNIVNKIVSYDKLIIAFVLHLFFPNLFMNCVRFYLDQVTATPSKWPVHQGKTLISLHFCTVWSESSLGFLWETKDLTAKTGQTVRMCRLNWLFATLHFEASAMLWLIQSLIDKLGFSFIWIKGQETLFWLELGFTNGIFRRTILP